MLKLLDVIMVQNSRTGTLLNFVGQKGSRGNTVMLELHNKMKLLTGDTGPSVDAYRMILMSDSSHEVLEKGGSNEEPVNAAGNIGVGTAVNISTASRTEVSTATPMTPPSTINVFEDEDIFLADALEMLSDKAKLKGVEIKEKKDAEKPTRSIFTLKPLPKINPKDKGKGVLKRRTLNQTCEEAKLERQRQVQASLNTLANLYDDVLRRIVDLEALYSLVDAEIDDSGRRNQEKWNL
ncbi:hypothetical protein Tco_0801634 [Tanacetum coccineum]|uniref:Uncharacterized protein n=1 Tax=Tanacetum coccineum TaxID=301880 RepID=A0ABQ4ZZ92_9ASTR